MNDDAPDTSALRFFGRMLDDETFTAPTRLRVPSLMTDAAMLEKHERADWQHVEPVVQIFAARVCEVARKKGVPLYVHSAFRNAATQNALNEQGVSKVRWPRAPHCIGCAVDIVHGRYHWQMTDQEWSFIGKLGREVAKFMRIEMRWGASRRHGGDYRTFHDPAHWELADWAQRVRPLPEGDPVRATPRGLLVKWKGHAPPFPGLLK